MIEARAEYLSPAFYDDVLEIRTHLVEMRGARVSFTYEVHRAGGPAPIATGFTSHAALDTAGRPRRLPEDLRKRLLDGGQGAMR